VSAASGAKKPPVQGHLHVVMVIAAPPKKLNKQGAKRSAKS
jgi:hypothetical protein